MVRNRREAVRCLLFFVNIQGKGRILAEGIPVEGFFWITTSTKHFCTFAETDTARQTGKGDEVIGPRSIENSAWNNIQLRVINNRHPPPLWSEEMNSWNLVKEVKMTERPETYVSAGSHDGY